MIYYLQMPDAQKEALVPNSLALPGRASFLIRAKSKSDVARAHNFAKTEGLPLLPLGDGTNIAPAEYLKAVVLILDIKGINLKKNLEVAAGENWDEVVKYSVDQGLSGLEPLSWIPGRAGSAPIQNIGAYGTEVADMIETVEAYDRKKEEFIFLSKKDCQFGYRDSIFKRNPERWIVAQITLRLHYSYDRKDSVKIPDYKDVQEYFERSGNSSPNLKEIRQAIIEIRKSKLPDPNLLPNAGSFFKNPIVSKESADKIKASFPDLKIFETEAGFKVPAGFLIEQAGFKGQKVGKIEVYKNNALVLTNPARASLTDLLFAKNLIQQKVFVDFGITLEPEVNIIR